MLCFSHICSVCIDFLFFLSYNDSVNRICIPNAGTEYVRRVADDYYAEKAH